MFAYTPQLIFATGAFCATGAISATLAKYGPAIAALRRDICNVDATSGTMAGRPTADTCMAMPTMRAITLPRATVRSQARPHVPAAA